MSNQIFTNVWYLPKEITWGDMTFLAASRSTGTLTVSDESVEFICKDKHIQIASIKHVSIGKQGRDFINNWVKIEYQEGNIAFFADGSSLGWSGILGGTKRIFNAVKNLIKSS